MYYIIIFMFIDARIADIIDVRVFVVNDLMSLSLSSVFMTFIRTELMEWFFSYLSFTTRIAII